LTSLHASRLEARVLQQVLVAVGRRLTRLTLHEQQIGGSFSDVFHLCPRLEVFHSSFCSYTKRSTDRFPVDHLRHLEMEADRMGFVEGGVGDVVMQLMRAPLLEHLHFFGLELKQEEVRPLVQLLALHPAVLTRLHTLAVFKRNVNGYGRCLVDNIILHCSSIVNCLSY
jgi:hypothetical protein